ncbi:hypothetical protein EVJ58_g3799 [Rhodofomes roseus]|uniref:NAD-dependent epimerase/dehydratase domain-containing protein n=1 Tax=Rhodofomes roseus TaxID=34475 RepID=A0A4Y9YJ29_9APHY|nr:hypothetical protein EVJ58_g3799 [Rhodofomes roseus]
MTSKWVVVLFGATGYVGGSVLNRLLQDPATKTWEIITPVRSPEKAKLLEKLGVKTEIASLSDHDKLELLASRARVVINAAGSDDLPAINAILKGMRKAHERTGELPILIHTSGTGEISEMAYGKYTAETVWSDLDVGQLKSVEPTAFHRGVDLAVVHADEEGYARTHIIMPGVIYGIATGPVFEAGIAKAISKDVPGLIKASLDRKRAGVVGPGKSVWGHVHIDDVADMYLVLLDAIKNNPQSVGHGWEGFYFGVTGHNTWYEASKAIGEALVDLGFTDDAEPTTLTDEELEKYWGSITAGGYAGITCVCRAERARTIGWKPKYTEGALLASLKPEAELQWKLAQEKGGFDFSYEKSHAPMLDRIFKRR